LVFFSETGGFFLLSGGGCFPWGGFTWPLFFFYLPSIWFDLLFALRELGVWGGGFSWGGGWGFFFKGVVSFHTAWGLSLTMVYQRGFGFFLSIRGLGVGEGGWVGGFLFDQPPPHPKKKQHTPLFFLFDRTPLVNQKKKLGSFQKKTPPWPVRVRYKGGVGGGGPVWFSIWRGGGIFLPVLPVLPQKKKMCLNVSSLSLVAEVVFYRGVMGQMEKTFFFYTNKPGVGGYCFSFGPFGKRGGVGVFFLGLGGGGLVLLPQPGGGGFV